MWKEIFSVVSEYGPFPVGIIIGILISRWSYRVAQKYIDKTIESQKSEINGANQIMVLSN